MLVGAGPRGETFARAVHRKRVNIRSSGTVSEVVCRLVVETFQCTMIKKSVCVKWCTVQLEGWSCQRELTAVEQSEANGRAEQRVRALRERLHILVEHARRCGVEIIQLHSGL